jgi:glutathione peroxidase
MTPRQQILKLFYPLLLWARKGNAKKATVRNSQKAVPPESFYSLSATLNSGKELPFENLRGKKVLLVNTASDCGYTPQYAELQKLYQASKNKLEIIAFPANDFKEQEKGSDGEIAAFCSINYGIGFPLAKKGTVIKADGQHPVFQWLSSKEKNGWNNASPSWNFTKYLVNEQGMLTNCFDPAISPLSNEVLQAIES